MRRRAVRLNDVKGWLETRIAKKLGLWLLLSLILSVVFFRDFWTSLPVILSPGWVLGQNHASLWGVLVLCLIFLWLKRKEVRQDMSQRYSLAFIPVGLALIAGDVFIPSSLDYLVFIVLLASLGVFVIFFGKGAKIPAGITIGRNCAVACNVMEKDFPGTLVSSGETVRAKRHRTTRKE